MTSMSHHGLWQANWRLQFHNSVSHYSVKQLWALQSQALIDKVILITNVSKSCSLQPIFCHLFQGIQSFLCYMEQARKFPHDKIDPSVYTLVQWYNMKFYARGYNFLFGHLPIKSKHFEGWAHKVITNPYVHRSKVQSRQMRLVQRAECDSC